MHPFHSPLDRYSCVWLVEIRLWRVWPCSSRGSVHVKRPWDGEVVEMAWMIARESPAAPYLLLPLLGWVRRTPDAPGTLAAAEALKLDRPMRS